ncbi:unnamed protein product [Rhodiola kirilowii]
MAVQICKIIGPLRCWPGGLCLSRSIGDFDVGEFIVPVPYVKQIKEVKQDSKRWRKRAILLIYLVQICLKPKQTPSNSSMNLKELSKPWRNLSAVVPLHSVDL